MIKSKLWFLLRAQLTIFFLYIFQKFSLFLLLLLQVFALYFSLNHSIIIIIIIIFLVFGVMTRSMFRLEQGFLPQGTLYNLDLTYAPQEAYAHNLSHSKVGSFRNLGKFFSSVLMLLIFHLSFNLCQKLAQNV